MFLFIDEPYFILFQVVHIAEKTSQNRFSIASRIVQQAVCDCIRFRILNQIFQRLIVFFHLDLFKNAFVTGQITDADFLKMNRQCDNEIDECNLCLEELEAARTSRADLNAHIAEIRRVLQAARDDAVNGLINRDFVQKYIDRIFVTVDNDKIQLQIKLFTSESTMRYLEKLERRSGHTFKKMIESYEQSLAAKG